MSLPTMPRLNSFEFGLLRSVLPDPAVGLADADAAGHHPAVAHPLVERDVRAVIGAVELGRVGPDEVLSAAQRRILVVDRRPSCRCSPR